MTTLIQDLICAVAVGVVLGVLWWRFAHDPVYPLPYSQNELRQKELELGIGHDGQYAQTQLLLEEGEMQLADTLLGRKFGTCRRCQAAQGDRTALAILRSLLGTFGRDRDASRGLAQTPNEAILGPGEKMILRRDFPKAELSQKQGFSKRVTRPRKGVQMDTHTILKNARAIMAERGLAKHVFEDGDGHVCLRGAINAAVWGSAQCPGPLGGYWRAVIGPCEAAMGFGFRGDQAPHWNNHPDRTLEEVLARFDEAIEATKPIEAIETTEVRELVGV